MSADCVMRPNVGTPRDMPSKKHLAGVALDALAADALAAPGIAAAATIERTEFRGELRIDAAPGEQNRMNLSVEPAAGEAVTVRLSDSGAPIAVGQGCTLNDEGTAV